jgi:hypothetical protein
MLVPSPSSPPPQRMHKTILLLLLLFLHNRNACGFGLQTLCCCLLLSSPELGLNKTVIITKEVAEDRKKKKEHLSQWYQTRINEFLSET